MQRWIRTVGRGALVAVIFTGTSAVIAAPAHPTLRGFHATGEFDLVVAGVKTEARIYYSPRAAAYLVAEAGKDSMYLLLQRQRTVSTVPARLLANESGDVDLPADVRLEAAGRFRLHEGNVVIDAPPFRATLTPRPPILGFKSGADVLAHSPQYGLVMRAYRPDESSLRALRSASGTTVEILFGTWCPRCQQTLGNALRVERELAGQGPGFRYYGMPSPPAAWKDPRFVASGAKALPTALVYAGDRLVGRLAPGEWKHFEARVAALLRPAAPAR